MNTKAQLAALLEEQNGEYLSGNTIAERLGITRAAIWKCIRSLQEDGYRIEAVKSKGYRLSEDNDVVSETAVRRYLDDTQNVFAVEVHQKVESTNQVLKEKAAQSPGWYTVISGCQTKGRGRRSRSFFSPEHTGVYLSVLVKLPLPAEEATRITTAAAVAACHAVEECTDAKPVIKWVNDVFVNGLKVCGILTEASISMESGGLDWAVMGIGFNVYEPEEGFPEELQGIAGAVTNVRQKDLRSRLAVSFLNHFYRLCSNLMSQELVKEYKSRSFLIGMDVNVIKGDTQIPAHAEDIDEECRLLVRYADGHTEALSSGEVSIRVPKEGELLNE